MSTETESLGYFLPYALALPESSGKDESRSQLSSRVYLPAFSIAAVATVLVAIGWASRWGGSNFAASMTGLRVVLVGPVTIAILAAFLVVERLHPAQRRPIFARGYRQDLLYTILNATIVAPWWSLCHCPSPWLRAGPCRGLFCHDLVFFRVRP